MFDLELQDLYIPCGNETAASGAEVLLTVEYEGDGTGNGTVEIHFDEEGAELLTNRLSGFLKRGERDHDHFMTPSWAGWELTEEKMSPEAELINKVNLRFWPAGASRIREEREETP